IRTAKTPFFLSRPSNWLVIASLGIVCIGTLLPFSPFAHTLGFVPPPPMFFVLLIVIVTTYLFLVEKIKSTFLKKYSL
ncbi:MAG TPA: hypothetical protein VE090_04240, partial [Methylomirabilota bacterium]|nr:hypothetical protein [Methylomirabilota bacterium]